MKLKTIQEVYAGKTFAEIETGLRIGGGLMEMARLKGASLTGDDRKFVLEFREAASLYGVSINLQTEIEQEGALVVRQAVRS